MFLFFFLPPYSLGCQPSNGGNNGGTNSADQLISIEMKLDIAPPAAWTFPKYGAAAVSFQSASRTAAREKIRADVTKMTNLILAAHNYPKTQVTCTPTIENYVQGRPVRNQCSGDGQLLTVRGTVVAECSQGPPRSVNPTTPKTTTRSGDGATTEDISTVLSSTDKSLISSSSNNPKRKKRNDDNEVVVPLNCLFMMDWSYFGRGRAANTTINSTYLKQRTFVSEVAHQLFDNTDLDFRASFGVYGDLDLDEPDNGFYDQYIESYPELEHALTYWLPGTYYSDVCEAIDNVNIWLPRAGNQCLIFISALDESDFDRCSESINTGHANYSLVFGVQLNGNTGISTQTSNLITVTDAFSESDVSSLVNRITDTVLALGPTNFATSSTIQSATSGTATGSTGTESSRIPSTIVSETSTSEIYSTTRATVAGSSTTGPTVQSSTVSGSSTTVGTIETGISTSGSTAQTTSESRYTTTESSITTDFEMSTSKTTTVAKTPELVTTNMSSSTPRETSQTELSEGTTTSGRSTVHRTETSTYATSSEMYSEGSSVSTAATQAPVSGKTTETFTVSPSTSTPQRNDASSISTTENSAGLTVSTTTHVTTAVTNGQVTVTQKPVARDAHMRLTVKCTAVAAGARSLWQQFAKEFQEELESRHGNFYKDTSF